MLLRSAVSLTSATRSGTWSCKGNTSRFCRTPTLSSSWKRNKYNSNHRNNNHYEYREYATEKADLRREKFGWATALLVAFGLTACAGIGHYMWDPDLKKTKRLLAENGFNPDEIDAMVKSKVSQIVGTSPPTVAPITEKAPAANKEITSANLTPVGSSSPSPVIEDSKKKIDEIATTPIKPQKEEAAPVVEILNEAPGMQTARAAASPASVSEQNALPTVLAMEIIEPVLPSKSVDDVAALKAQYEAEIQKLKSSMEYKVTEAVDEAKRVLDAHYKKRYEQSILVSVGRAEQQLQQNFDAQVQAMRTDVENKLREMEAAYRTAKHDREEKLHQLIVATEKYREKVERSFVTRTDSLKVSHICLTLFALRNAMDRHEPLDQHVRTLRGLGAKEDMVDTVLKAIPDDALKNGVPTMANLQERFSRVQSVARRVSLVPEDGGGLMWHVFAGILSRVLIPPRGLVAGDEPEAKLARAQYHLQQGDLLHSVQELESMPPAAREVARDWLKQARARLLADQATSVLEAHALTLISNLSKPSHG